MRKAVCLCLIFVLLFPARIAKANGIINLEDFEYQFNLATIINGTNHKIGASKTVFNSGEVNDVFQVPFGDYAFLQVTVPHGEKAINGLLNVYIPDGNTNHAADYVNLIKETLYAAGIIDKNYTADDVFEQLGFYQHLDDGDENNIYVNGYKVGYMVSSMVGIWFYIETDDSSQTSNTTKTITDQKTIGKVKITSSNDLNVRSEPTSKSEKIGIAKPNHVYDLLSIDGKWYKIQLEDGVTGWISSGKAQRIE